MKQLFIFILLCCFCGLSAATGDYTYRRNIPYRAVPSGDAYTDSVCRLDVAVPKGVTHAPVVVWFHGGGLTGGSRELPEPLLNGKLVVVGVEYRLSPKATIQEILDDAAAAVAWAMDSVEYYGGSKEKIYLSGHSAGGYLIDMVGLDKSLLAKYGKNPDTIA